jgi:hypothetical protein
MRNSLVLAGSWTKVSGIEWGKTSTGAYFYSWNLTNPSNVVATPLPRTSLVAFNMQSTLR